MLSKQTIVYALILVSNLFLIEISCLDFMLMAAQCESFCIYKMGLQNPQSLMQRTIKNYNRVESLLYSQCFAHPQCLACVKPCSQPFSEFSMCLDQCKGFELSKKRACMESCAFLRDININKVGNCPSIQQMSGFALACIESCQKDSDCGSTQKCCAHRCGRTCQYPETITEDVPPKPIFSVVAKGDNTDEGRTVIRLEWQIPASYYETTLNNKVSLSSILYVVQSQINLNVENKHSQLSEWRDIAITGDSGITLNEQLPGSWIRFRVASINPNGTLGYSEPCVPIMFSNSLNIPEMPINLTIGEYTVNKNGKINQIIHWSHPKSDLPIVKYKIFWSQNTQNLDNASSPGSILQQYKKVLQGKVTSYVIENLEPEKTYFIQLQALSQKDDLKLRGEKASIFLTTPNLYESHYDALKTKLYGVYKIPNGIATSKAFTYADAGNNEPIVVHNISIDLPYFQNGSVKAQVSWKLRYPALKGNDGTSYNIKELRSILLDNLSIKWHAEVCIESSFTNLSPSIFKRKGQSEETDDNLIDHISISEKIQDHNYHKKKSFAATNSKLHDKSSEIESYTTEESFTLYDLKFNCRYVLTITPTYKEAFTSDHKPSYTTHFQTPTCSNIKVNDLNGPNCPIKATPPAIPQNLTSHIYLIDGYNITALITWRPPQMHANEHHTGIIGYENMKKSIPTVSHANIIGYRLVFYGRRGGAILHKNVISNEFALNKLDSTIINDLSYKDPYDMTNNVLVKVFSPFQTSFHVSDLLHGRDYAVDVQAFSQSGPGLGAHIEFRTPELVDEQRYIKDSQYRKGKSVSDSDRKQAFINFKEPGHLDAWKQMSLNKMFSDIAVANRYFYFSSAHKGPYGNVRYLGHPKAKPSQYKRFRMKAKSHSTNIYIKMCKFWIKWSLLAFGFLFM